MTLMDKARIEEKYSSYEQIAQAFSAPGGECTEIYLCIHENSQQPSHYEMVRRPEERESLLDSPYIKSAELAWSKNQGTIIPYKSNA
jgi:hypothetical protein